MSVAVTSRDFLATVRVIDEAIYWYSGGRAHLIVAAVDPTACLVCVYVCVCVCVKVVVSCNVCICCVSLGGRCLRSCRHLSGLHIILT